MFFWGILRNLSNCLKCFMFLDIMIKFLFEVCFLGFEMFSRDVEFRYFLNEKDFIFLIIFLCFVFFRVCSNKFLLWGKGWDFF